jgi:carbon monoxide dehydrogenase subunit G
MRFEGQQTLNVPIETAWAFLTDPHSVAACTPGFLSMEILSPDHFKPVVAVGVGSVKAKFTLDVKLVDVQPPHHATATARGAAAGSAAEVRGGVDLVAESETTTSMRWSAEVDVMGTIASMGARLMESTAHKLTAKFFDCLRQKLEAPAPNSST